MRCLVAVVRRVVRCETRFSRQGELFQDLYPGLRRFAGAVAPLEIEPEDLVQEALTRLLGRGSLASVDDPGAYLRATMVRLASNHRRSLGRRRRFVNSLNRHAECPLDVYPSDVAFLEHLSIEDRAVVYLTVVESVPAGEIGHTLGWSAAKVRVRKHRALQRLRRLWEVDDD
ncbi:MAG: RNA polymerase sigma factor [Gaiellales bacterium]